MPVQRCTYCDRQFTRTEHLSRHIRSHTKEKPFKCSLCGRSFVREDSLIRHTKSHSAGGTGRRRRKSEVLKDLQGNAVARSFQEYSGVSPSGTVGRNSVPSTSPSPAHASMSQIWDGQDQNNSGLSPIELRANSMAGISGSGMAEDAAPNLEQCQTTDRGSTSTTLWNFDSMPFNTQFLDEFSMWSVPGGLTLESINFTATPSNVQDMQMLDPALTKNTPPLDGPSPSEFALPPPVTNLGEMWFTKFQDAAEQPQYFKSSSVARTPVSDQDDITHVDDQYRDRLSRAFHRPLPQDEPLPSSDFLNLCVRMYFTRFNPIFPIVHSATFRPTSENGLLLLSMTSMGCLFLGSKAAVRRGRHIFERLNKAILASWENVIGRRNSETLAMLQASIIGQTFAILSSDPRHIAIFEAFHGAVVLLARRGKMLGPQLPMMSHVEDLEGPELETAWKIWATREEICRISAALRIHDAESSALLHREPSLRQLAPVAPILSTSRSFFATTASAWASIIKEERPLCNIDSRSNIIQAPKDVFSGFVLLEGLGTLIADDRRQGRLDDLVFNHHHQALLSWHESYGELLNSQPDELCLKMLWHWTYMCLLVDFDQLERAIGRDGSVAATEALEYVSTWISSPSSTRCVLHALLSQRQLQSLRFDKVSAIHVPRIVFCAAIAWYCYLQYGPSNDEAATSLLNQLDLHFPEFGILDQIARKHLSDIARLSWKHGDMSAVKAATLCELGDSLQRMSNWGIAERFARIVACLIYGGLEENGHG